MKKFKKMISVLVATSALTFLVGCTDSNTPPKENPEEIPSVPQDDGEVKNGKTENDTMKEFLSLIKPQTKASELGLYIKDHIKDVSKTEADKMIEWLLIYQTEIIQDFNEHILDTEYINALNEDMDGVLAPDKIKNIKDESVREDYQSLVDGLMTIVRQEETPVVQTDWKQLEYYSSNTTDNLNNLIKLYSKVQNLDYNREQLDVVAITDDILETEDILEQDKSTLIKWQGEKLYDEQLYMLLVGPEGEYLERFRNKNDKEYEEMIKVADENPDTRLSKLIKDLDKMEIEDSTQVTDRISQTLQFGVDSENYIETVKKKKENGEYNILNVHFKDDKEKQDRINKLIESDTDELVKEKDAKENIQANAYSNFENQRYISYNGLLDYDEGEEHKSIGFYRVLDYMEEKYVTIEEYFETNTDQLKIDLEKITGKKFETLPNFYITQDGVNLLWLKENGQEGYTNLNYKDLMEFFTLEEFLEGKK